MAFPWLIHGADPNHLLLLMEEILHHLGSIKPYEHWDKLPTSTGAGFLPSTVVVGYVMISGSIAA